MAFSKEQKAVIEARENRYIELNKKHMLQGEREIAVLFEEADGIGDSDAL